MTEKSSEGKDPLRAFRLFGESELLQDAFSSKKLEKSRISFRNPG